MWQGREEIEEDDMFTALEKIQQERLGGAVDGGQSSDETVCSLFLNLRHCDMFRVAACWH